MTGGEPAARSENLRSFVVMLHHRPGALDRFVGLVRRQGCVLITLTLGPSGIDGFDRVTCALRGGAADRMAQQAPRLVDVIGIHEVTNADPGKSRPDSQSPFQFQADGMSDPTPPGAKHGNTVL